MKSPKVKSSSPSLVAAPFGEGCVSSKNQAVESLPIEVTITGNYARGIRFYAELNGKTVQEYIESALASILQADLDGSLPDKVNAFLADAEVSV